MRILVDTNVHLHAVEVGHANHAGAKQSIVHLIGRGHHLVVFPQVVYEFWSSSTAPVKSQGLGQSVGRTRINTNRVLQRFRLLTDTAVVLWKWYQLVSTLGVTGRDIHDAHLVASMQAHSITHILTFNGPDFAVYPGITILDPLFVTALSQP
jgi:predicted nucleic acid-binding protein